MPEARAELLERGYNNRAACPDHPQWFARWAAESEAVRARVDARLDLRYGPRPRQILDIFAAQRPRAGLLFIHGGYWRAFDKSLHSFVAGPFVDRGVSVAVVNYDLCPAVGIPDIVEECRQAVAWLVRHGGDHDFPSQRLVAAGHSAGGHLVAMLLATDWSRYGIAPHVITAGVAISGLFDLEPLVHVSLNADLRLDSATARAMSPARMKPTSQSPLLLVVGADETGEFIRQTRLMWDAWPDNRPPGATSPMQVADRHHFSVVSDLADPDSALCRRVLELTA